MSLDKDIAHLFEFEGPYGCDILPITKCICGKTFQRDEFTINVGRENLSQCPACHRRLYFIDEVRIFEVVEENKVET